MSPSQMRGTPYASAPPVYTPPATNAALLIDFDNVTVAIRGDLGKELKALLNSDVIRGKVSVQRAYADWRRYPQYIVPLAESSVDLIFAPAYGPGKKNATDLRMAIDAMELVFTRPEIGTFILLTGDSDFSSCVLKLKEYGKYVIGVGMRESSSDLLIQNCDEYYSYHSLSGLTRTGEDEGSREDPWQLVRHAAERMVANGDSMRTDRLKQVMMDLDPGFDEKKLGYSKFSRFVSEAANKGLIRVRKSDAGQYEIMLDGAESEEARSEERESSRDRGRRNGRGRDRPRTRAPEPQETRAAEPQAAEPEAKEPQAEAAAEPRAPETTPEVAPTNTGVLEGAYAVLQHAVRDMVGKQRGATVRDGELKRHILELAPGFDETQLGFSKFTRFLRQAHDAEVIDLRQVGDGNYDVSLPANGKRLPTPFLATPTAAPEAQPEAEPRRGGRGRRGGRTESGPPAVLPGQVANAPAVAEAVAEPAPEAPASTAEPTRAEPVESAPATVSPSITARPVRVRGRRVGRGQGGEDGPPPLLPGQVVSVAPTAAPTAEPAAAAAPKSTESEQPADTEPTGAEAAPEAAAEPQPEAEAPTKRRRSRGRGRGRKQAAESTEAATPDVAAEAPAEAAAPAAQPASDLPTDRAGIEAYLRGRFKGVGQKTVESLYSAFGDDVLLVMESDPDRVRQAVEGRRIDTLLRDFAEQRRTEGAEATSAESAPEAAAEPEPKAAPQRSRGKRGGRGRSRKKSEPATPA